MERQRPKALFLGLTYAGWKARQERMEANVEADGRLAATHVKVTGWQDGGLVERIPGVPRGLKSRARGVWQTRAFASIPRPDVVWTTCCELLVPHLWAQLGPLRRPLLVETDWTIDQAEEMAEIYFRRPPRRGLARSFARAHERLLFANVSLFLPISNWAADGLRKAGVEDRRIVVLPPGVDLTLWQPAAKAPAEGRELRLLFVGGDFERKGGLLLIEAMKAGLWRECRLDVVTRDSVPEAPNVTVHRAEPNSPLLRRLFAEADLFTMPTRAECFGFATVEALASGLPAIIGDVGGARDIVSEGHNGWLIPPTVEALVAALRDALDHRERLPILAAQARRVAERKFDGVQNDRRIVDLMLEQAGSPRPVQLGEVTA
ncbi:MAG: glycosyltransferase family 4 protein [Dehalococcoidia bacterium]